MKLKLNVFTFCSNNKTPNCLWCNVSISSAFPENILLALGKFTYNNYHFLAPKRMIKVSFNLPSHGALK